MRPSNARISAAVFTTLAYTLSRGFWNYAFHARETFSSETIAHIIHQVFLPAASAFCLAAAAWLSGRAALRRFFDPEHNESPLKHAFALAIGIGIFGIGLFGVGVGGLLTPAVILLLAFMVWAPGIFAWADSRRSGPTPQDDRPFQSWEIAAATGIAAYAVWTGFITACAPPIDWDVLAYHLAIPKLYLASGSLHEIPWMIHSHWPHMMELIYSAALAARMDTSAAIFHWIISVCWIGAVYAAAKEEIGRDAARISAAILACQPAFLRLAGTAHSDGALALFYFLAAYAAWKWGETNHRPWIWLAGIMGGLALSCKLTIGVPLLALSGWIWTRNQNSKSRRAALEFLALVAAISSPWFVKTWIGADNPVWPFLSGIFGGRWHPEKISAAVAANTFWSWPPNPDAVLRYGPQYLFLPFAPAAAFAVISSRKLPGFIKFQLIPAATMLALFFRHDDGWRYFMPFYPALAMTIGAAAAPREEAFTLPAAPRAYSRAAPHFERPGRLRYGAAAVIAFCLFPALQYSPNNQLFYFFGMRSAVEPNKNPRDLYLERSLDQYKALEVINEILPASSKILLFQEIRGYYLTADYQWGDPVNQSLLDYSRFRTAEELRAALADNGITHVLINRGLAMYGPSPTYYKPATIRLMEAMLRADARQIVSLGPVALYELN